MSHVETSSPDPSSIEHELRQLWKTEAQEQAGEPVVCTRTLNLVVYCPSGEDPRAAAKLLEPIADRHPCRAVLVIPNENVADPLRVRVSASCRHSHSESRFLGCEVITIEASPSHEQRLPSMISSLLIPDLPSFLWWRHHSQLEAGILEKIASEIGHVIIDSSELQQPWPILARLHRVLRKECVGCYTRDLAWSRLTPWRQMVAQFFDGSAYASYLSSLRKLTVEYSSANPVNVPGEAVLLAAWIANRLQYQPAPGAEPISSTTGEKRTFQLHGSCGSLELEFRRQNRGFEGIGAVHLSAQGEPGALFSLVRTDDPSGLAATVTIGEGQPLRRVVRLAAPDPAQIVGRELEMLQRDELYEQVLATALALAGTSDLSR